jgi:paraquat-inducible protein B
MNDLKPEVSTGKRFSAIWIIPLVALGIGVYMVIHGLMTEGPEITIAFANAEGLEAGKTKIRFRDVDVGLVESVALGDSMDKVIVTARMDLDAEKMLREDTRFWVVRARIGAGSISGIGTLLSGAYIQVDPGTAKKKEKEFLGLEVPPLTPADAPGVRLVLHSEQAGSLSAGDVILYNGFKVGRIEGVTFDAGTKEVRYDAFIDAPYNDLVTTNTRFWNTSGIAITASASGVQVRTGSMETVLLGGVAFGIIPGMPPGEKAKTGESYKLSASYSELIENPYRNRTYFVVEFKQSLRGLEPGAPVEYRGIQMGRVERILVKELADQGLAGTGSAIPVLLYLEPGRLGVADSPEMAKHMHESIIKSFDNGMRASLQTGNLLTGKLYISFDFYEEVEAASVEQFEGHDIIPSIPTGLGRLEKQVGDLLDKFNALPLNALVTNADTALKTLDGTMASLTGTLDALEAILLEEGSKALPGEISQTLAELRQTLGGLSPDSAAGQSLSSSIFELNRTLRNLEELTRTLSDKPNSLIFPTDLPADPIPEARAQ